MPIPQTPPPATGRSTSGSQSAANRPGSITLTVANEQGQPLADATVSIRGSVDRGGVSGSDGVVTLQNLPPGTYRARITRADYFTLDKEVTVKAGAKATAEAVLSLAPPPPPPPAPPPAPTETKPAVPAGKPGSIAVLSLVDLIDQMRKDPEPVVDRDLGCAYAARSRLIVAKANVASHQHADVDEFLYVVYGDGTLTVGDKAVPLTAGSFALAPRGVSHAITKKGSKEIVLLVVQSGMPCSTN
ncbi:MAG TPA: carboxypeptidase regulatory-like domain-containing protein [Vicinamibacterales bacterium]|nr:carboxypeptidase regulatory-like domain-containing protein [Vicinamibacterales bacterium]